MKLYFLLFLCLIGKIHGALHKFVLGEERYRNNITNSSVRDFDSRPSVTETLHDLNLTSKSREASSEWQSDEPVDLAARIFEDDDSPKSKKSNTDLPDYVPQEENDRPPENSRPHSRWSNERNQPGRYQRRSLGGPKQEKEENEVRPRCLFILDSIIAAETMHMADLFGLLKPPASSFSSSTPLFRPSSRPPSRPTTPKPSKPRPSKPKPSKPKPSKPKWSQSKPSKPRPPKTKPLKPSKPRPSNPKPSKPTPPKIKRPTKPKEHLTEPPTEPSTQPISPSILQPSELPILTPDITTTILHPTSLPLSSSWPPIINPSTRPIPSSTRQPTEATTSIPDATTTILHPSSSPLSPSRPQANPLIRPISPSTSQSLEPMTSIPNITTMIIYPSLTTLSPSLSRKTSNLKITLKIKKKHCCSHCFTFKSKPKFNIRTRREALITNHAHVQPQLTPNVAATRSAHSKETRLKHRSRKIGQRRTEEAVGESIINNNVNINGINSNIPFAADLDSNRFIGDESSGEASSTEEIVTTSMKEQDTRTETSNIVIDHQHPEHDHSIQPSQIELSQDERIAMARVIAAHVINTLPLDMQTTGSEYVLQMVEKIMAENSSKPPKTHQNHQNSSSERQILEHANVPPGWRPTDSSQGNYLYKPYDDLEENYKNHQHSYRQIGQVEMRGPWNLYLPFIQQTFHLPAFQHNDLAPDMVSKLEIQRYNLTHDPHHDVDRQDMNIETTNANDKDQQCETNIVVNVEREQSCICLAPTNETGRVDYVLLHDIGWFKLHNENKIWNSARKTCVEEGAHLAVLESEREAKWVTERIAYIPEDFVYLGIHRQFLEDEWVSVVDKPMEKIGYKKWFAVGDTTAITNTTKSIESKTTIANTIITERTTPIAKCGALSKKEGLLTAKICTETYRFVCKIPIHGPCRSVCSSES